jgi:hypothetical protein
MEWPMRANLPNLGVSTLPRHWPTDVVNWTGLKTLGALISASAAAANFASRVVTDGAPGDEGGPGDQIGLQLVDQLDWPARPLRLGVVEPRAWAESIHDSGDNSNAQWFEVPRADSDRMHELMLDGLIVASDDDGLDMRVLLHPGHDATWYDWGTLRPLSYTSVFPLRLDCERLTCSLSRQDSPELVRALIDAAAWSSRWPSRLTLRDRVAGRQPCVQSRRGTETVRPWRPQSEPFVRAVQVLLQRVCGLGRPVVVTPSMRVAARIVSAHLTTSDTPMTDSVRRAGIEACAAIARDEPEILLRLAAARLACVDDDAGTEAIRWADRAMQGRDVVPCIDPYSFLQAEMGIDQNAPLAVGRLAAGVCMLASPMSAEKIAFVREDLMEDMQFSSLLIGREQDQRLLMDVMRTLEASRREQERERLATQAESQTKAEAAA